MTSTAPATGTIIRARGDTFPFTFTIKDASGTVVDITGRSYKLTVDPSDEPIDDTNNLFTLVGTLTDPTNGVVEFELTTGQADNLGEFFFDLQQIESSYIRTVMKGTFEFVQDITKATS